MTTKELKCSERIESSFLSRREDLEQVLECKGDFSHCEDTIEALNEFSLCFDYVEHEEEDKKDFWRFQISWGGPSEEFRIFTDGQEGPIEKIEYWFLDWFDGASKDVTQENINEKWTLKDFFYTYFLTN